MPDSPSIMTDWASSRVRATRAMRRAAPSSTCARTHSAPVRVFPKPRPARIIQVSQSPGGGNWDSLAWRGQAYFNSMAARLCLWRLRIMVPRQAALCDLGRCPRWPATLDTRSAPLNVLRVSVSNDILCIRLFAVGVGRVDLGEFLSSAFFDLWPLLLPLDP